MSHSNIITLSGVVGCCGILEVEGTFIQPCTPQSCADEWIYWGQGSEALAPSLMVNDDTETGIHPSWLPYILCSSGASLPRASRLTTVGESAVLHWRHGPLPGRRDSSGAQCGVWKHTAWIHVPALPSCSRAPQFPHLSRGLVNNTYFAGLIWRLNALINACKRLRTTPGTLKVLNTY